MMPGEGGSELLKKKVKVRRERRRVEVLEKEQTGVWCPHVEGEYSAFSYIPIFVVELCSNLLNFQF